MPEHPHDPPKRDRQRLLPTYTLAAIAVAGLALLFMALHVLVARNRVSIEITSTRTQCYQGQPRRELFSMRMIPGVDVKVLQDRTIGLRLPLGEFQQQPDAAAKGAP